MNGIQAINGFSRIKGGGNCRRRVATAILSDFEISERLKHLDNKKIKGKTANQILKKLSKSLVNAYEPKKINVDINNIAKLEEGFTTAEVSRLAEEARLAEALKKTSQKGFADYNKFFDYVFENLKKSEVKNLERLVDNANATTELYKEDKKSDLLKNLLNAACLKDYMPMSISKAIHKT